MTLICVQPFLLDDQAGGPRIMRSLLHDAPAPVLAVSSAHSSGTPSAEIRELALPIRPGFGRLETTRACRVLGVLDMALIERHARRLSQLAESVRAQSADGAHGASTVCLHAIPHSLDFAAAERAAARQGLPLALSLHDDPSYALQGRAERSYALRRLAVAWRRAAVRFVISEQMGAEMSRRYGERPYSVVTDGLETVASAARAQATGRVTVYFMGAAHISYRQNFDCLVSALAELRKTGIDARLVTRSGDVPISRDTPSVPIEERPWAPQAEVMRDFDEVDVAYLPLPFGAAHENFVRLSLSTKMISYLGSGVPTLVHAPADSAAAILLRGAGAALAADSLDVRALADVLGASVARRREVAERALGLARERFMLPTVRARFWDPILALQGVAAAA